jgi:hypothetical protein
MAAFVPTLDGRAWDGPCNAAADITNCTLTANLSHYSYVDNSTEVISPYHQIASLGGFSNWMFQINQGPSFLAHQFLFSGTSAPVEYNTMYYNYFAAENPLLQLGNNMYSDTSDTVFLSSHSAQAGSISVFRGRLSGSCHCSDGAGKVCRAVSGLGEHPRYTLCC